MGYLRTKLATDWAEPGGGTAKSLLASLAPEANPNYKDKWHLIREWHIEFDDDDSPWREIGLDSAGVPVLAGPSHEDYGFWLDTNMRFGDFTGEPIEREEFDKKWAQAGGTEPD